MLIVEGEIWKPMVAPLSKLFDKVVWPVAAISTCT
jgi:hypothetical protein